MNLDNPNEPVMLVRDSNGKLIEVGHPTAFRGAEITKKLKEGHTLETITITQYRERDLKLYHIN